MRTTIVALQSKQPFTVAPAVAFPSDEFDVVVLTDGPADAVLREDVTGLAPERSGWSTSAGSRGRSRS
jgi:hypothetical protein